MKKYFQLYEMKMKIRETSKTPIDAEKHLQDSTFINLVKCSGNSKLNGTALMQ